MMERREGGGIRGERRGGRLRRKRRSSDGLTWNHGAMAGSSTGRPVNRGGTTQKVSDGETSRRNNRRKKRRTEEEKQQLRRVDLEP